MDLDDQASIQQVVDRVGKDGLVVLLGSPNPESAELYAVTVTMGDPTYAVHWLGSRWDSLSITCLSRR